MAEIEKLEAIARAATPEGWTSQDIATFSPERVLALLAVVRNAEAILPAMAECQEIARQWEPDDSSGKERQWLVRGRDAAKSLRTALAAFDALEQT